MAAMEAGATGRARPPAEPATETAGEAKRLGGDTSPHPQRKPLGHATPGWVRDGGIFFVTVCAKQRGGRVLLEGGVPEGLVESVRFLHERGDWFAWVFVVMPDHVHGLIAMPGEAGLATRVAAWKGDTAKRLGVAWQARFFDHRLRSDESLEEKARYIRSNPVRAGLVETPERWPHVFAAFGVDGSAGTPRPT